MEKLNNRPLGFQGNGQGGFDLGEEVPQADSYQEQKQTLKQLVGAKLTHVVTILTPPTAFLDTVSRLMANLIWQRRHGSIRKFCMGGRKTKE
jgi:hypothetical protein